MRSITLEEHFSTPEFLAAMETVWQGDPIVAMWRANQAKLFDVGEARIADMDAAGIQVQVLSLSGSLDKLAASHATALAIDTNDRLAAAVRAHPDRFAAFATLALQEQEKAALEFERCVGRLGFKGALVNGTCGGLFLDDLRFSPLFEAAESLDVPIYLHPGPPPDAVRKAYYSGLPGDLGFVLATPGWGWHVETGMHCLRLMLGGVFDRFPKLKVIIGHLGEALPYYLARSDDFLARGSVRTPRRIGEYFRDHFYITTSGCFSAPPFLCALEIAGVDRMLFSVDYPYDSNARGKAFLEALPVSDEDKAKISYGNAKRLLNL